MLRPRGEDREARSSALPSAWQIFYVPARGLSLLMIIVGGLPFARKTHPIPVFGPIKERHYDRESIYLLPSSFAN
jgi:hypothetical protein